METTSEQADFPHAQTLLRITNFCSPKRAPDQPTTRYFISSLAPGEKSPSQWMQSIRGHWAGVENRNHWRKDACLFEDKTRSKNPRIVANLILLRNALLRLLEGFTQDNLPASTEAIARNPTQAINLISRKI